MPELPEVETIRRDLHPFLKGRLIREVIICPDPKGARLLRRYPSPKKFIRALTGRRIMDLKRRGKYLLFPLDSGEDLIVHLGMSGQLLLLPPRSPRSPHTRLVLKVRGAGQLCLVDPRKFGEVYLCSRKSKTTLVNPECLGVEPLGKDFTPARLARALAGRKVAVKTALLNQKIIAGLGNIYSDEALFRARINPLRKSYTLKKEEINRLHREIRRVLREAIKYRGTTAADRQYVDGKGRPGKYQDRLEVYQREGKKCPRCGEVIQTRKIGGRTAHFCPACQV